MDHESIGLAAFRETHQGMAIVPSPGDDLILRGEFSFHAQANNGPALADSYRIEIRIPKRFPATTPLVFELDGKVPRDGQFHVNPDKSLCLGSPLRLKLLLSQSSTLLGFAERCIVPFLYAVSWKQQKTRTDFFMGELDHGASGVATDYASLFGLNQSQAIKALSLLGLRKRAANKRPCPCECGLRLGRCKKRFTLNRFRTLASRSWFRAHAKNPGSALS